jgi:FixJ family two-component response regulator
MRSIASLMATIFLETDDSELCSSLLVLLQRTGFRVSSFTNTDDLVKLLRREIPQAIIAQAKLSKSETANMVIKIKTHLPDIPVIIVATAGDISAAMEALRAGAHDYIEWPIVERIFIESLEQAISRN